MRLLEILHQDLRNILHNPALILSNTVLPLILIGVIGFVTKGGFGKEFVLSAVCYGVLVPVCQYVLGLNMGGSSFIYFVLLLNIFGFFGCCFGTMFCCIFKEEEQANAIMQIPLFISILLGGVVFQVHRFGGIFDKLSLISPVKWVAACSYQIIYDNDLHLLWPVIAGLLTLSFTCIGICQILFKPEDYL